MRLLLLIPFAVAVTGGAQAATDFIAPGTPATIGRSGSLLGAEPGQIVAAPRGALRTFGLSDGPPDAQPPLPGDNSYSLDEAKRRIEAGGFGQVNGLIKDNNGVWRGQATRVGKPVKVYCDFKGNVGSL